MSGHRSRPAGGGVGIRCARAADSDTHTSGSARARGRDLGIAPQRHAPTPQPTCSWSPPCPPTHHHPAAAVGNPDASRSFAGRDSGRHARHGARARGGSSGSADQRHVALGAGPPGHRSPRSRSGRDRSSCRSAPEPGSARTRTAAPVLPTACVRPRMDGVRDEWNSTPACVLGTVWGTASIRTWRFRSAPCLPIRQWSPRHCAARCAPRSACGARRPVDMWTTQEPCPHTPRPSNSSKIQFDDLTKAVFTRGIPAPKLFTTEPPRRRHRPFRHLYADPDSHSQAAD
jgi:hypothetical protein